MFLPVATELQRPIVALQNWAASEPLVSAVYIYGSRLRETNRPDSDLDVAVSFDIPAEEEPVIFWIDHKQRWKGELTQRVGLKIDLEIAHPILAPKVWGYLKERHALVYLRGMETELRQGCDI